MTDQARIKEMLEVMVRYGEQLRTAQKNRSCNKDKSKKNELANRCKQCEGEFDNVLFNAKQLVR